MLVAMVTRIGNAKIEGIDVDRAHELPYYYSHCERENLTFQDSFKLSPVSKSPAISLFCLYTL
jgi:hypothetical protein